MKVYCDYCGSHIEATAEECPHCGAVNTHFVRTATDTPTTIEELKAYCDRNRLPLDRMHVHLGEDYRAPKAFGIYKDQGTGHFIVYKNKGNGERAVRYEGTDEAYAVNELYIKIKDLVMDAREHTSRSSSSGTPVRRRSVGSGMKSTIAFIIVVVILMALLISKLGGMGKNGYYNYDGDTYYRHGSHWYLFDDSSNTWDRAGDMSPYIEDDDYLGRSNNDADTEDFPLSDFSGDWDTNDDWNGGNDNSWDDSYDSYDFDSGGDWDSDW